MYHSRRRVSRKSRACTKVGWSTFTPPQRREAFTPPQRREAFALTQQRESFTLTPQRDAFTPPQKEMRGALKTVSS